MLCARSIAVRCTPKDSDALARLSCEPQLLGQKLHMGDAMPDHKIVTQTEWLDARRTLLEREKAFTRERDELTRARQALPWVRVETDYVFDGPNGKESLSDLFAGRSQLIIYHFMFGADWDEGCPGCSFWADGYDHIIVHLNARDVSLAAISTAPLEKLSAYKKRLGWSFNWLSAAGNSFNRDFHVSFTEEELSQDEPNYNFGTTRFNGPEAPGMSVFFKDADGVIYHTYSAYSRGLDMFNPAYHYLGAVPKGRDEDGLSYAAAWLRRSDSYETG